ncbi:hypothetical protein [Streptococcus sp. 20-1249]|uniref:hypothetical protein n=1 Tax=Streptococcus hepaticus TaxID=3349163 RepID=UPI003747F9F8
MIKQMVVFMTFFVSAVILFGVSLFFFPNIANFAASIYAILLFDAIWHSPRFLISFGLSLVFLLSGLQKLS